MKKKIIIVLCGVIIAALLALAGAFVIFNNKPTAKSDEAKNPSKKSPDIQIEIDNTDEVESSEDNYSSDNLSFIEPDETEADKLLNENNKLKENSKAESAKTESAKASSEAEETESVEVQTFEEGKIELEDTADDYLKANKIDPKTAGETGEICPNCGKKIWNPDKYGFFIPGMPDDYENSDYCLGTCGISLE